MGCNSSKVDVDSGERAANKKVEEQMKKARIQQAEVVKLLLLGTGESGKSTIFKQMKLLYGSTKGGFSDKEKEYCKNTIHENILHMLKQIINKTQEMGVTCGDEAQASLKALEVHREDAPLNPEMGEHIKKLWADPVFQTAWDKRSEYQVVETHTTYIDAIDR
jgi:energy-coupling factor transporter ATP-binding protein EcfA2